MQQNAKHSATPWVCESLVNPSARSDNRHYIWRDTDPQDTDTCVAIVCAQESAAATDANAAHIVKCINAHDALVALLHDFESVVKDAMDGQKISKTSPFWQTKLDEIRAAQVAVGTRAALAAAGEGA